MLDLSHGAKILDVQVEKQVLVEPHSILLYKRRMDDEAATVKCLNFDGADDLIPGIPCFTATVTLDLCHVAVNDLYAKSSKASSRSTNNTVKSPLVESFQQSANLFLKFKILMAKDEP